MKKIDENSFKINRKVLEMAEKKNILTYEGLRKLEEELEDLEYEFNYELPVGQWVELEFKNEFADDNLNNLSWWTQKHVGYAIREAADLLDIEFGLTNTGSTDENKQISEQAHQKRMLKHKYAMKPLFWRSFAYFIYRYFFKLGFLEGKEGFLWHFLQGWWYRTLVDAKIFEIKKACGNDKEKIIAHLKEHYNIVL